MNDYTKEELIEVFEFLDSLRESGMTNMFGAPAYIVSSLGWSKKEASSAFGLWAETFGDDSINNRVESALSK